jgi:hypothetical protein
MKIMINRLFLLLCLAGTLLAGSCKKDYTSGGSLSNPVTPLNNMDYLSANQYHQFDTAVLLINKLGLATEVNNAKTFFAFTDFSIQAYISAKLTAKQNIDPKAVYSLDSLAKDIGADTIRQYMFGQTIELSTATVYAAPASLPTVNSLAGITMFCYSQLQVAAPYTNMTKAPTYLLYFGKLPAPGATATAVLCQTTGIKTSNGNTTLHVLANTHVFARF